jgi:hypothetical protein
MDIFICDVKVEGNSMVMCSCDAIIINGDVDFSPREATFCRVRGRKDRRVRA